MCLPLLMVYYCNALITICGTTICLHKKNKMDVACSNLNASPQLKMQILEDIITAKDSLAENEKNSSCGQLLINISKNANHYREKLQTFFTAIEQNTDLTKVLALLADKLNFDHDLLLQVLNLIKTMTWLHSQFLECFGQSIEEMIGNIYKISEDYLMDIFKKIKNMLHKVKNKVSRILSYVFDFFNGIFVVTAVIQVISIYTELKDASNVIKSSQKKLAPGGSIEKYINETQEHIEKANKFFEQGKLEFANRRLERAGESASDALTVLSTIETECNGKIKTLKREQVKSAFSVLNPICNLALHFTKLVAITSPPGWILFGLSTIVAGMSFSACVMAEKRINELQAILEEVQEKMNEVNKLKEYINKLRDSIELEEENKKDS